MMSEPHSGHRITISMGDFNGIGPEIILRTVPKLDLTTCTPVVAGHPHVFEYYADLLDISWPAHPIMHAAEIAEGRINVLNCLNQKPDVQPGTFSKAAGSAAMEAVQAGIDACLNGTTDALVTAPISKEAIQKAGYTVPGHTEFLAQKTGTDDFMMMLVHKQLRVGLVTIHEPLARVASLISRQRVLKHLHRMDQALRDDFRIPDPRIAVLGLNPHAGDGGVIGNEEIDVITPALLDAKQEGILAEGAFPADGFFGNRMYKEYDGVLAMYHDQGLVPFKTLSFGGGVNVTTGLPIVRTSPDHGTAFDIAGQGKANPSSFQEALSLALTLSTNRSTTHAR